MKRVVQRLVAVMMLVAVTSLFPLKVVACEVALVMALDVSRSVDREEYKLMRNGIGSAFLDDEIISLIGWMPGGVMITVTQWGGMGQQRQAMGWQQLSDKQSVLDFVSELSQINRGYWMADTAVSEALLHANAMFGPEITHCRRQVIDVSGDGISNAGPPVWPIANAIGGKGITINGLVVAGARPNPVPYFTSQVIAGPLPFVEVTGGYQDYAKAMKRKLLRELAPVVGALTNTKSQSIYAHPVEIRQR